MKAVCAALAAWLGVGIGIGAAVGFDRAAAEPAPAPPPAADVVATVPVLEVLDPSGAIDAPMVQDALAKQARALGRCATTAGWTGDALAWIILDWHGKVTKLELAVDKPAVETCVADELRRLVITHALDRTTVIARLHFAPAGKADAPPAKRGELRASHVDPGARFADPERVRGELRAQLQDASACYEQALAAKPGLAGGAALDLTITATGLVDSAIVTSAPGSLADCLRRAFLHVRLPAPSVADKVHVELVLEPAPPPAH